MSPTPQPAEPANTSAAAATDARLATASGGARRTLWILLGSLALFAILVVWMLYHFVLGPGLMSNVTKQRRADAQNTILALSQALEGWSSRNLGRYPDSLALLLVPDANGRAPLGDVREVPRDPWGHEFQYAPPTPGQLRPTLRSLGRDGLPGGSGEDADIDREGAHEDGDPSSK